MKEKEENLTKEQKKAEIEKRLKRLIEEGFTLAEIIKILKES